MQLGRMQRSPIGEVLLVVAAVLLLSAGAHHTFGRWLSFASYPYDLIWRPFCLL